jgi:pimeloyl-ACP methyl ester carboxylesterase
MLVRAPADEVLHLPGKDGEPSLLVRRQGGTGPAVLYVHGATFPSALSVAWRFEGRSWMDHLAAHSFDAWAFDLAGYGGSDREAGMQGPDNAAPIGRAREAVSQLARVVDYICNATGQTRIALVAHSWGSLVAGLYASEVPDRVRRLCLFGPIGWRDQLDVATAPSAPAWRLITVAAQHARFVRDVPEAHDPVLIEPGIATWGAAYLATDPDAHTRTPPAVKVPGGPEADIQAAWSGDLAYAPGLIRAPTLVVRGEWDSVSNDKDAAWLLAHLAHPARQDVKIAKGTHLMHLERSREGLFAAVNDFLVAPRRAIRVPRSDATDAHSTL